MIAELVSCNDESQLVAEEGHAYLEAVSNDMSQYVNDGAIVDKPLLSVIVDKPTITADGSDVVTITGIPEGATVRWNDMEMIADGNDIEFMTDIVGEHKLRITLWPYKDAEVTIHAI